MFNLVPRDSKVMQLAEEDDWRGLSELFREGHASPHDYSSIGSLMDVSDSPVAHD